MKNLLSYSVDNKVATIVFNDGKVNAMSVDMMQQITDALDQARQDGLAVVLAGSDKIFSAGFDLSVFKQGYQAQRHLVHTGAELVYKLLSFPLPTVAACTGHAYPMGAFLLMASDVRYAAAGDFKIGLNEVAIGMTLPAFAVELARSRLSPSYFNRSTITAEMFNPEEAVIAGFVDEVCAPDELIEHAQQTAARLTTLDLSAHAATKLKVRKNTLQALRIAIDEELVTPQLTA